MIATRSSSCTASPAPHAPGRRTSNGSPTGFGASLESPTALAIADPKRQTRGFVDLIGHGDPRAPAVDADRYRRIECPVWILRGSEDRDWMPESREDRFRELIPSARVTRWEGVGHAPHIQAPGRYGELLGEFVEATKENARPGAGNGSRASDERGIS